MLEVIYEIAANQDWEFPLSYPLVLEPKNVEDWGKFQHWLKVIGYINQDGYCLCGRQMKYVCDLHHALISRKDFDSCLIHSSYNVVVCHKECHPRLNRGQCLQFLSDIFGIEPIENWYNTVTLQMKGNFRKL